MIENKKKSGTVTQNLIPSIEFIKQFNPLPCYKCGGKGKNCAPCKGTGQWNEDNYHLIATLPNGDKIGFQVDGLK